MTVVNKCSAMCVGNCWYGLGKGWKGSLLILEWLPRSRCCHCVTYDLGRQQLSKLRNSWYRNKVACFMTFEEKNLNCEAMCETCYINSHWHQSQPSWKIRSKSHRCTNSIRFFFCIHSDPIHIQQKEKNQQYRISHHRAGALKWM